MVQPQQPSSSIEQDFAQTEADITAVGGTAQEAFAALQKLTADGGSLDTFRADLLAAQTLLGQVMAQLGVSAPAPVPGPTPTPTP